MTADNDVTLDKISYMMDRMTGNDELTADDLETLIHKTFASSFEFEYGFEPELIAALVDARYAIRNQDNNEDEDATVLAGTDAENWYLACQKKMYMKAGCAESYAEESASWPDSLPLHADWDAELLEQLARKAVAHHLVVMEQVRREMEKHKNDTAEHTDS